MAENENLRIVEVYQNIASVPIPWNAVYIPKPASRGFIIETDWTINDFAKQQKTNFNVTYTGFGECIKDHLMSTFHDSTTTKCVAFSVCGNRSAVLRQDVKEDSEQYIEIWQNTKKALVLDVSSTKEHGKIYDDSFTGGFVWNHSADTLLYVAEKYAPKSISFFKQVAPTEFDGPSVKAADGRDYRCTRGNEYLYQEDWGEGYTGKKKSVICTYNVNTNKITALPLNLEGAFLVQPIWDGSRSIYFVAIRETPYKLGLKFCLNRMSIIYHFNIETGAITRISDKEYSSCSPCLSLHNQVLIYLQNKIFGPHQSCSQLVKYSPRGTEIVVDFVTSPIDDGFPGLYIAKIPNRCTSNDGRYVFVSSVWRSRKVVLAINLINHEITRIANGPNVGSCTVLDVWDDVIIASASSPNTEPYIMAGQIYIGNDYVEVFWNSLVEPRGRSDISYEIIALVPPLVNNTFPDLDYEVIVMMPSAATTCDSLILIPHGGPHSVQVAEFNHYYAGFVKLGFAVCIVNYRGSIGFGSDSIDSLIGNIGMQDVDDCYNAIRVLKSDSRFENANVYLCGGSHGGFLVTHLCASYPGAFVACALRNPVIDLLGMFEGTDIPDWVWTELGRGAEFNFFNHPNEVILAEMWNRSPLRSANEIKVPTLLLLGKTDRRVPPSQGLKYYYLLKASNAPVSVYWYDDGHSLQSFAAQSDGFMQIMIWFRRFKVKYKEHF